MIVLELLLQAILWILIEIIYLRIMLWLWKLIEKGYEFFKYRLLRQ